MGKPIGRDYGIRLLRRFGQERGNFHNACHTRSGRHAAPVIILGEHEIRREIVDVAQAGFERDIVADCVVAGTYLDNAVNFDTAATEIEQAVITDRNTPETLLRTGIAAVADDAIARQSRLRVTGNENTAKQRTRDFVVV